MLNKTDFLDAEVTTVPILNREDFPLANIDSLMAAGWPKAAGIEARGILAVTTYLGAADFADSRSATYESIQNREYHHIFPDALLSEADIPSFIALNCALITWKTNRIIGRKDPLDYLKERVQWADEAAVRERLKSHLISYDMISKAHYANLKGDELKEKVKKDFNEFLLDRANLVVAAVNSLAEGNCPRQDSLWAEHAKGFLDLSGNGLYRKIDCTRKSSELAV